MTKKAGKTTMITKKRAKKSHAKDVPVKTFIPPKKECLCCGEKMKRMESSMRYITQLTGRMKTFVEIYACQNEKCELYGKKRRPTEFLNLVLPQYTYGIDIFAQVGYWRFREKRTVSEIREELVSKYPHIEISERHTENLVKTFMTMMNVAKQDPSVMREKLRKGNIKGLVLSLDGLEPEKGNEILYVVREVQTGEIIFAIFLEFSDKDSIQKQIIEPIKKMCEAMDLPVLGWVVDKQLALTQAIEEVFPELPIQHCQSHFLKEARKPVREADTKMATELKKNSGV